MQNVAPGLGDNADLCSRSFSIFSRVSVRQNVELSDSIDPQKLAANAARRYRKLTRPGIFNAVQQEQILCGPPSGHRKCVPIAGARLSALHRAIIDRSRVESYQVIEASAVERQILHFALSYNSGDRGCRRIDYGSLFRNYDLLNQFAHFEPQV